MIPWNENDIAENAESMYNKGGVSILTTIEEKKKYVQKFNVFDDTFFEMVAKDKDAVEDILRVILHDPELIFTRLIPQNSVKNLYGRSVRLDALCVTGGGRHINVEVQKGDNDNHAKRVRYNASCITANVSEPGENYENISDVYVIYISEFDVFNRRRRLYHVERSFCDKEGVVPVHDGEHLIYVNASREIDTEAEDDVVAELMQFFKHSEGQNDKFRRLTNRVHDLKNNESEVDTVCKLVEDFAKEYAKNRAKEMICGLVRKGALSAEIGAEQLELSMEEFDELLRTFEQEVLNPV